MGYRFAPRARQHIREILAYSLRNYGRATADRYELLISAAAADLGAQPVHPLSRPVPGSVSLREFDLRYSRSRAPPHQRVANPVHKIVYSIAVDGDVEIVAVIGLGLPSALGAKR